MQSPPGTASYYGGLIVGALSGASKANLLPAAGGLFTPTGAANLWTGPRALCVEVEAVAAGSYRAKPAEEIVGKGHVLATLETASWAFDRADGYAEAVRVAVSRGWDTDTTAAVVGQLAGTCCGVAGIPPKWLEVLTMRAEIEGLADGLFELRQRLAGSAMQHQEGLE